MTLESASPRTSTPIQKLSVQRARCAGVVLNCSSNRPRGAPPPCTAIVVLFAMFYTLGLALFVTLHPLF
jgi:hypothetical protein